MVLFRLFDDTLPMSQALQGIKQIKRRMRDKRGSSLQTFISLRGHPSKTFCWRHESHSTRIENEKLRDTRIRVNEHPPSTTSFSHPSVTSFE